MKGKELEGTACSEAEEHKPFVCFTCTQCACVCVFERIGEEGKGITR